MTNIKDERNSSMTCVCNLWVFPYSRMKALTISLKALKLAGVHGIAVEVWWGVVEGTSPMAYNWSLYEDLFNLISDLGLKLQVALSFHSNQHSSQPGRGVSLPQWIMEVFLHSLVITDTNDISYTGCSKG